MTARSLAVGLLIAAALNTIDAVDTAVVLHLGIAGELNPLMAAAWAASPLLFLGGKFLISAYFIYLGYAIMVRIGKVDFVGSRFAGLAVWGSVFVAAVNIAVQVVGWLYYFS